MHGASLRKGACAALYWASRNQCKTAPPSELLGGAACMEGTSIKESEYSCMGATATGLPGNGSDIGSGVARKSR